MLSSRIKPVTLGESVWIGILFTLMFELVTRKYSTLSVTFELKKISIISLSLSLFVHSFIHSFFSGPLLVTGSFTSKLCSLLLLILVSKLQATNLFASIMHIEIDDCNKIVCLYIYFKCISHRE